MCEQNNNKYFSLKDDSKHFIIKTDPKICNDVFVDGFNAGYLKIFRLLDYLSVFTKMLSCLAEESLSLQPKFDKLAYDQIQEKAIYCSGENRWSNDSECVHLCNSLPVINGNVFSKMMITLEKSKLFAKSLIEDYSRHDVSMIDSNQNVLSSKIVLDKKSIKDLDAEEMKSTLPKYISHFDTFIEPLGGESSNKQFIQMELTQEEGLNILFYSMITTSVQKITMNLSLILFLGLVLLRK